jgi:hypothetical protein
MSARWSKLQKEIYLLRADGLRFDLHCSVFRMASQRGSTDLPRYWITLDGETIWDYPKDFIEITHPLRAKPEYYPYQTDVPEISELIREYIDTPKAELLSKQFENDHWGLVNILRAADRRIGLRRLPDLRKKTRNQAARKVIEARLRYGKSDESTNSSLDADLG